MRTLILAAMALALSACVTPHPQLPGDGTNPGGCGVAGTCPVER